MVRREAAHVDRRPQWTECHGAGRSERRSPSARSLRRQPDANAREAEALLWIGLKPKVSVGAGGALTTATPRRAQENQARDRHAVILDYLKTAPGVLSGVAAVLAALTGLLALLVK